MTTSEEKTEPLEIYAPVYALVKTVPPGKVVTYGQVAGLITEVTLTARQVGSAMKVAPRDVPWQRVVGAGGTLPTIKLSPELYLRQKRILKEEGVEFVGENEARVEMKTFGWRPEGLEENETGDLFGEKETEDE